MNTDVGVSARLDHAKQTGDAVDERLAPNEANIFVPFCLPKQMLAGSETNLEPHLANRNRKEIL